MQNIDPGENNDNLNKFENLQLTEPTSLESLTCEQHKLLEDQSKSKTTRALHSDPEESQAKTKTRSRFSSALKKLSGRKKEKPKIRTYSTTATESSEHIISSGAEDLPETKLITHTEKKSKKKKKSIFGLKKSKVAAKEEDCITSFEQQEEETAKLLEPIFQDNENEVVITTERLTPLSSRSKVQITIKSKKIETVASQEQPNKNPPTSSSPSPTNKTENDTFSKSSNEPSDIKKKLKTTQTPQKSTTTTKTAQSKSKQREVEQEQITITRSSKDTPPKERAPTKPTRLTTLPTTTTSPTSQSSTSSGAIRKTAITTRAAIKLVTGAKAKKKLPSLNTLKGSIVSSTSNTAANWTAAVAATKKETDLMINPQRGHRLPRPTSTTKNTNKEPQTVATTTSNETQAIDHTTLPTNSLSQNQTTTIPDSLAAVENLPQTSSEIQSYLANASLETPPSRITATTQYLTSDSITSSSQQQQEENIQTSPINNSNSVQLTTFPQADDHISIAESVKPGDFTCDTHYDSLETIKDPVTVHFAVGSPVRAPFQQSLYEFSTQLPSTVTQKSLDDHKLSVIEVSRRPIRYISQSRSYDESVSLELKRSRYRFQSEDSVLSLDTDETHPDILDDLQPMPAFGDLTMDQDMEPVRISMNIYMIYTYICKMVKAFQCP